MAVEREGDGDEFFVAVDEVLIVAFDGADNVLLVEEPYSEPPRQPRVDY